MQIIKKISETTRKKRNQIASLQDEFTTFSWGGVEAFENFGAFIINDKKGSLKFYNGAGFSNEYSKPQFDNVGGYLQGVSFEKQSIDFTIGVYWISIEDYRKLLQWLNPLKVDYLQFGFAPKYRYDVKLAKRADTTRWIVGRENGEPRYYTEIQLKFDVQGTPCAKGMHSYEFINPNIIDPKDPAFKTWYFTTNKITQTTSGICHLNKETSEFVASDLETPVQVNFKLNLTYDNIEGNYYYDDAISVLGEWENETKLVLSSNAVFQSDNLIVEQIMNFNPARYEIKLEAEYNNEKISLCSMTLQHLTTFVEKDIALNFTYYSETGLVFIKTGETTLGNILTLQTFTDTGEFLVESLETNKFMLPGELDYPEFYNGELKFILSFAKKEQITTQTEKGTITTWVSKPINQNNYIQPISIESYPRTNVI